MERVIKRTSRKDQKIATKSISDLTRTSRVNLKKKAGYGKDQNPGKWRVCNRSAKALDLLFNILSNMAEGKSISLVPSDSEVSTQQAADMLNVSRPHLVKMLEQRP